MEALSPGELARVVRGTIGQFRDETVRSEVRRREQEAAEAVMEATESVLVEEEARINQIRAEAEEIYERYRVELRDITNRLTRVPHATRPLPRARCPLTCSIAILVRPCSSKKIVSSLRAWKRPRHSGPLRFPRCRVGPT
jgi:hypothetical protein